MPYRLKQRERNTSGIKVLKSPINRATMAPNKIYYYKAANKIVQIVKHDGIVYTNEFKHQLERANEFSLLKSKNGISNIGNNIYIAWGEQTLDSDSELKIKFLKSFPNECFSVIVNSQIDGQNQTADAMNITRTGFSIDRRNGNIDCKINYIALGR